MTFPICCPFCWSLTIYAEGSDTRMAMVCQKCLARGPEVPVSAGRDAAITEWNKRKARYFPRAICPVCGQLRVLCKDGTFRRHRFRYERRPCAGSDKPPEINDAAINAEKGENE